MNLFEEIMVTMAKMQEEEKKRPKVVRKKIATCLSCERPIYNTNPEDTEEPRFTILKNSMVSEGGKGFSVVGNFKSHSCIVQKPTKWTAELHVKETLEKIKKLKEKKK